MDGYAPTSDPGVIIPFAVVVGLSAVISMIFGFTLIRFYRRQQTPNSIRNLSRLAISALVLGIGILAIASVIERQLLIAIVGGLLGISIALLSRNRGMSPHTGCADTAIGAVFTHRLVEGIVIAGLYSANISLGLIGLVLLTGHAVAETAAVGGLYAPIGRNWAVGGVIVTQLSFIVGAVFGATYLFSISTVLVGVLLAIIGGILIATGTTELVSISRNRH